MSDFKQAIQDLLRDHQALITRPNAPQRRGNGTYQRWQHPILTAEHTPVFWRYDLNPETNPLLLERQGINSTFNAGALYWHGKYILAVRVEGDDRKDRKSTRLNSSHVAISYAVFCLKKRKDRICRLTHR